MQIHRISFPFSPTHGWKHRLVFAGDFHFGAVNCDEGLIRKFVKTYASPTRNGLAPDGVPTSIFFLGDEIDAINCQDNKRFDPRTLHPRYRGNSAFLTAIANDFVQIMRPLRGQIVGSVMSNHITRIVRVANVDLMDTVREKLAIKNLGYSSYVPIQWLYYGRTDGGSVSTVLWLSHGVSSKCLSAATRAQNLERTSISLVDADIVVQGHSHELSVDNPRSVERLARDYRKIYISHQFLIQSGTFLLSRWYDASGWGTYNEQSGIPIGKCPGWAVAEISFPPGSREKQPVIQCFPKRFGIEAGEGGTKAIIG